MLIKFLQESKKVWRRSQLLFPKSKALASTFCTSYWPNISTQSSKYIYKQITQLTLPTKIQTKPLKQNNKNDKSPSLNYSSQQQQNPPYNCQYYIQMQLSELLQRRLKISINAANHDPSNSESIKNVLTVVSEMIINQYSIIEIVESEINDKISESQFQQSLSGKLSVKEFLGYFQKIQKIVEKMENYWSNSETKTIELINSFGKQIQKNMHKDMQYHLKNLKSEAEDNDRKSEQFQEIKKKILYLKNEISEISKENKHGYEELHKKMQFFEKKENFPQEKLTILAKQMLQMQQYFNQSHEEIKELLHSFNQNKNTAQSVPYNIGEYIGKQLEVFERKHLLREKTKPNRWIWQWNSLQSLMKWQKYSGSDSFSIDLMNQDRSGMLIKKEGLYKITMGYFIEVDLSGDIELTCNNSTLHHISLQGQYGNGLCKTTMLYVWVRQNQEISVCTANSHCVRGFFQIQMF